MYYKGTHQECLNYDKLVTESEKINAFYKGDNYANPIEINGEFYILKHDNYTADLELVNELPEQEENI